MMGGLISFKYLSAEDTCITMERASRSEIILCCNKKIKNLIRQFWETAMHIIEQRSDELFINYVTQLGGEGRL